MEPDRLGPPSLGGSARTVAAMVPGRRSGAVSPRRREWLQARGLPGAPDHAQATCRRRAEGARLQLGGDRTRMNEHKNCNLKIPLPVPCRGRKIPLPDDRQIKSIECVNHLIRMELSAMRAINFEPRCCAFGVFSLTAGRSRARGAGPASRSLASRSDRGRRSGLTSISNSRSWCIGRSPRCGSARPGRISGIARTRQGALVDR